MKTVQKAPKSNGYWAKVDLDGDDDDDDNNDDDARK